MAFLIAIPVGYLSQVLSIFSSKVANSEGFGVDPYGQSRTFLSLAISFIPLIILFLLLPSLFGDFSAVRALRSWGLLFLGLISMTIRVFLLPCRLISFGR